MRENTRTTAGVTRSVGRATGAAPPRAGARARDEQESLTGWSKKRLQGLGLQLAAARAASRLSQVELAARCGMSRPTVRQAETGAGQLASFLRLASEVGCSVGVRGSAGPIDLGAVVLAARKARRMSRAQVAASSGVSIPTVAAIEAGQQGCHLSAFERFAAAVGVRPVLRGVGTERAYWNGAAISSANECWKTPPELLERLYPLVGGQFDLDPCSPPGPVEAMPVRAGAYYTAADDGLSQPWTGNVFINCPYGRGVTGAWTRKASQEVRDGRAASVIGLVPARSGTAWWHETVAGQAHILFLRGRLQFVGAQSVAPFDSALAVWGGSAELLGGLKAAFPGAQFVVAAAAV